ncbi:MAG: hypothetical protein FE78DRAFT_436363 [Acidomyces sp. 'richmondensis']|nr:MAG: hypothetical protein FE78DRAFT_436363 [Acidomyces sp. 'richmondensis']
MAASPGGSAIIGRVRIQGEVVKISKPHVIYAACRKSGTRHVSRAQRSLLTFVFTGWILCLLLVRSSVVSIAFVKNIVKNMYDVKWERMALDHVFSRSLIAWRASFP